MLRTTPPCSLFSPSGVSGTRAQGPESCVPGLTPSACTPRSSLPLTCWALPTGSLETSLLAVEAAWAGLAHRECGSGRLEKVPVGHGVGLHDAAAKGTGGCQSRGQAPRCAAVGPVSELGRAPHGSL